MIKINDEEITFICCGRIFQESEKFSTKRCLMSVRKLFPKSKIILSTWKDEKVNFSSNLYDQLILNEAVAMHHSTCLPQCDYYPKPNSYDLQQLSMFEALKHCSTKYTVRFRTDFYLRNRNFLRLYNKIFQINSRSDKKYQLFSQKVLIHSLGTLDPHTTNLPMVHHPSDIFFFGRTEDIKAIYDNNRIPDQIASYFTINKSKNIHNPCLFNHLYTPEQYFWIYLLDKNKISYKKPINYLEIDKTLIDETDILFLNNFIILNEDELGVASKFDKKLAIANERFYKGADLIERYIQYFSSDKRRYDKLLRELRLINSIKLLKQKLKKHWDRFRNPNIRKVIKWLSEIFSLLFYASRILIKTLFLVIWLRN